MTSLFYNAAQKRLGPLARGYLLWFEQREQPAYAARAGLVLLLVFAVLEYVIGPRASILAYVGVAAPAAWLRITALLLIAVLAVRLLAGVKLADVGFLPPWRWRAAESLYLAQVLIVAGAMFYVLRVQGQSFVDVAAWTPFAVGVGTQLLWGFYQELVYRGILQTELMRRFGGVLGALVANIAFTFGPLHFYYLAHMTSPTSTAIMLAAIFGIGLVFAFIYARTRNVWLVGIMHGIGNVFTSGVGAAP